MAVHYLLRAKIEAKAKPKAQARAKPKEELDVPVSACLECLKNGYPRMLAVITMYIFTGPRITVPTLCKM
jgi:hypothetical protein